MGVLQDRPLSWVEQMFRQMLQDSRLSKHGIGPSWWRSLALIRGAVLKRRVAMIDTSPAEQILAGLVKS